METPEEEQWANLVPILRWTRLRYRIRVRDQGTELQLLTISEQIAMIYNVGNTDTRPASVFLYDSIAVVVIPGAKR